MILEVLLNVGEPFIRNVVRNFSVYGFNEVDVWATGTEFDVLQ